MALRVVAARAVGPLAAQKIQVAKGKEVELADCRCQRRGTHGPGRNCHPPETRCGW